MPDYVDDNQSELFQQLATGSQLALQEIMQRNESLLLEVINRIVQNPDLAKEVCNHTFHTLWLNREEAVLKNKPIAWLLVTARNGAINKLRAEKIRMTYSLSELMDLPGASNPDFDLEVKEQIALIDKAVAMLNPAEKQVFILMDKNGFSRKEAAQQLNRSEFTVRNQLTNARRSLRKLLEAFRNLIVI